MSENQNAEPQQDDDVVSTDTVPAVRPHGEDSDGDVRTDPALDDRLGSDWSDEGGATPAGPATSVPGDVETEQSKRHTRIDRERDESHRHEQDDG